MPMSDAVTLVVLTVILGCRAALLSYRFYAAYHRWSFREFVGKAHLPGILGTALMLFAIVFASSLGWPYALAAVLGGSAVSYLYTYVFGMRAEAAGDPGPWRQQAVLGRGRWDADALRDVVRSWE